VVREDLIDIWTALGHTLPFAKIYFRLLEMGKFIVTFIPILRFTNTIDQSTLLESVGATPFAPILVLPAGLPSVVITTTSGLEKKPLGSDDFPTLASFSVVSLSIV